MVANECVKHTKHHLTHTVYTLMGGYFSVQCPKVVILVWYPLVTFGHFALNRSLTCFGPIVHFLGTFVMYNFPVSDRLDPFGGVGYSGHYVSKRHHCSRRVWLGWDLVSGNAPSIFWCFFGVFSYVLVGKRDFLNTFFSPFFPLTDPFGHFFTSDKKCRSWAIHVKKGVKN